MKRTVKPEREPQYAALIRAAQFLDHALKQGVLIGVEDEKVTIDDAMIAQATVQVRKHIDAVVCDLDRLARALARHQPGSLVLQ